MNKKKVYIYHNYITADEELIDDKIFEQLSRDCKYPSDGMVEQEYYSYVETDYIDASDVFEYMKNGYIFLEHCGKE